MSLHFVPQHNSILNQILFTIYNQKIKSKKKAEEEKEKEKEKGEEEEGEEVAYIEIDRLQDVGIGVGDINKLKAAGLYTVGGILMRPKKELCLIKGISEAKADKIREAAGKLKFNSFITGNACLQKRSQILKITTGSATLDKLLGGGVESMSITEGRRNL